MHRPEQRNMPPQRRAGRAASRGNTLPYSIIKAMEIDTTMNQKEFQWDKLLRIKTTGRDDSNSDEHHYPYEPTPYCVLERLADSGYFGKKNIVLDYGTGKGRVCFYLSYQTRCRSVGIEYDGRVYSSAVGNQETAVSGQRTDFVPIGAEQYLVPEDVDRCYFFNPFSVEILKTVLARIMDSYCRKPRELFLFFYYPSDEYVGYLMTRDELMFVDEIDCRDLFPGEDPRERILILEAGWAFHASCPAQTDRKIPV